MNNLKLPTGKDIVYKIRRRDGLFSMGGSWPHFNKTGKIWKQRGHLTSHINQLSHGPCVGTYNQNHSLGKRHVYEQCEIVAYRLTEQELDTTQSIMNYIAEREQIKWEEKRKEENRRETAAKENRKATYEELKKEFE